MKRALKILLIVLAVIFGLFKLTEWYLQYEFEALINKNPDRAYDITYSDFDLHTFFRGITLDDLSITPINKTKGTIITGTVDYAELTGFAWRKFIFRKTVDVNVLSFVKPEFVLSIVSDSTKKPKASNLQNLFGDILSRVDLNEFQIKNGSILLKEGDTIIKGKVNRIDIVASEIETDSMKLTHIIPFQMGNLEVRLDSVFFQLNSYTKARMSSMHYSLAKEGFFLKNLGLEYDKDWVAISKERGLQDDVLEFSLDELRVSQMNFSSGFWTDLDIEADKMLIDGLTLSMKRNKNLQRPPDVAKPLFKGMLDKVPFKIDLDSIKISNSKVLYGELSVNKHHTGVITINDINGAITQLSTFPEQQETYEYFNSQFTARINDAADMTIELKVPYDKDQFNLHTTVGSMNMTAFNESLIPLLGVEFNEGSLRRLDYRMHASYYQSSNQLQMDYENLHLTVYKEEEDGSQHKQGFLSSVANTAIRHHNLPEDKKYIKANYTTQRNIYRSPFQHIVAGVLDGAKQIVPGRGIQSLLKGDGKKKKKKK